MSRSRNRPKKSSIVGGKFTLAYGPEVLTLAGPIISANWTIPTALAEQLHANGQPIPPRVSGHLLLDTGASRTCISKEAADQLGLVPTGTTHTYGAGGLTVNTVVSAQLLLRIQHSSSKGETERIITWESQVQAVPDMEKHGAHLQLREHGRPVRLIGLLGRDILAKTKFSYNGIEGKLTVSFDRDWLAQIEGR